MNPTSLKSGMVIEIHRRDYHETNSQSLPWHSTRSLEETVANNSVPDMQFISRVIMKCKWRKVYVPNSRREGEEEEPPEGHNAVVVLINRLLM